MRKSSINPGHITASKHVRDRVNTTVSPSEHLSVSETSRGVLSRTRDHTPDNEYDLRGLQPVGPIHPEVIEELKRTEGIRVVDLAIRAGLLVVA